MFVAGNGISQPFFVDVPMQPGQGILCVSTDQNVVLRLDGAERKVELRYTRTLAPQGESNTIQKLADWFHFGLETISGFEKISTSFGALRGTFLFSSRLALVSATDPWLERKWRKMHDWHTWCFKRIF